MGGRIFSDSENLAEDKAKILFDYYKKAAEKIVAEERAIEEKEEAIEERIKTNEILIKKRKIVKIIFLSLLAPAAIFFALMIYVSIINKQPYPAIAGASLPIAFATLAIYNIIKIRELTEENERQTEMQDALQEEKNAIRRDYKVSKLGAVYVPVASSIPFEGKSFVVDYTGAVENTDFSVSVLRHAEEFKNTLSELEARLEKVPIVEGNKDAEEVDSSAYSRSIQSVVMHDYMGGIDRQIRKITYLLDDAEKIGISLPLVKPKTETDDFLETYATKETEQKPIVKVFDTDSFIEPLDKLSQLNKLKKEIDKNGSADNTAYFKNLIKNLGENVQLVSQLKTNSVTTLLSYYNFIFANVLKSPYNHYSPALEAEEISRIRLAGFDYQESVENWQPFNLKQSSRVKFDLFSNSWLAEDGSRTAMPFGMHQIQEEVLMPVINNLMNETRIERLKIYNNIKDQKMSYLNKWSQDIEAAFRDNRARGQDLITEITNAYSQYNTAYQTYISYKATQEARKKTGNLEEGEVKEKDSTAEQIAGFQAEAMQCNAVRDEFQAFMDRLTEDIEEKTEKFSHIEFYEASLRDGQYKDIAKSQSPESLQALDARRQRLLQINSYYATFAKLPPEPATEEGLDSDFSLNVASFAHQKLEQLENTTLSVENEREQESSSQNDN